MWPPLGKAATISVLGNQFRVEVTLHKWQMLETAFALRPVLFRALDAPTSGAWLCSWSIHDRHDAGDAAQSDLRDFCNRPQSALSAIASPFPPTGRQFGCYNSGRLAFYRRRLNVAKLP